MTVAIAFVQVPIVGAKSSIAIVDVHAMASRFFRANSATEERPIKFAARRIDILKNAVVQLETGCLFAALSHQPAMKMLCFHVHATIRERGVKSILVPKFFAT